MTWERNRPTTNIPVAVKRFVRHRSCETSPTGTDWCEAQLEGICRGDYRLQYDHIDGVTESGGPALVNNTPSNIRLLCSSCHNHFTQLQAQKAASAWKLQPERHPGLKR